MLYRPALLAHPQRAAPALIDSLPLADETHLFGLPLNFVLTQGLTHALQLAIGLLLGRAVLAGRMQVHDTRKLLHFLLFLAPVAIGVLLPHKRTTLLFAVSGWSFLVSLMVLAAPIRGRVPLLQTAFAAIDRPEDRPHSLSWMISQLLACYVVIAVCLTWLKSYGQPDLIFIITLAICFGDGLAEPIGVRFGRHKYPVPSLVRSRRYHRSIEGSLVVLVCSAAVVALMRGGLPDGTFPMAIWAVPLALTLSEAVAPHTWDGPLMYLAGTAALVAVIA